MGKRSVAEYLADTFVPQPIQDRFGDPAFLRAVHGWATWFWVFMAPVSALSGLKESISYLVMLSVYAVVTGHWASWQSARAEISGKKEGGET